MRALAELGVVYAVLCPLACEATIDAPASGGSTGALAGAGGGSSPSSHGGLPAVTGGVGGLSAGFGGEAEGGGDGLVARGGATSTGASGSRSGSAAASKGGGTTTGGSASRGAGGSGQAGSAPGPVNEGGSGAVGGSDALPGGAAGEGTAGAPDIFAGPPRCTSGLVRDPNESEGPEMMPGFACVDCHALSNAASGEGDAPIFAFAGTLFPSAHEPDSCIGAEAEGAEIVVTDATGVTVSVFANAVGNFGFEDFELELPITARVLFGGRERAMEKPAVSGDCNLCHTQAGANGAPGRIVLP